MGTLVERMRMLFRSNLHDILDKAQDPEKTARQLVRDMENQLVQAKTALSAAVAQQQLLLEKKAAEEKKGLEWLGKAEKATAKGEDDLARAAIARSLAHKRQAESYNQQVADQNIEVTTQREAFLKFQQKLDDTKREVELQIAQSRRNRASSGTTANAMLQTTSTQSQLEQIKANVAEGTAKAHGDRTVLAVASGDSLDERFAEMERNEDVESILLELKQRKQGQLERPDSANVQRLEDGDRDHGA